MGIFSLANSGSPPLTRVLLNCVDSKLFKPGITPAHAGTTRMLQFVLLKSWDHPRSRGYYGMPLTGFSLKRGSPPLTRVLQQDKHNSIITRGITPAHAGTTLGEELTKILDEDHPRSRGYYHLLLLL